MDLTHTDIIEQEREYLRLEQFFRTNSHSWLWRPVPQNGLCCLSGIWSKHPGPFDSLDKLISASALAAMDEVDKHSVESRAGKHHLKVVFRDLAKHPDKLVDMWPDLEVQYVWLALANSVFQDLRLRLHTLEGDDQLRCVHSIPDDTVQRDQTINLLQWNRKVAAHYDLIEEVVEAPQAPTVVVDVESDDKMEIETMSSSDDENVEIPTHLWKVGTKLEAEMMDPNFPNYKDTIHPVKVVEVVDAGKGYRCRLLAFGGQQNVDVWNADLLHEPREFSPNDNWVKGDKVHFRICNRKVGKVK
jgi:hypothetical protein